jgi:hypothetical protein
VNIGVRVTAENRRHVASRKAVGQFGVQPLVGSRLDPTKFTRLPSHGRPPVGDAPDGPGRGGGGGPSGAQAGQVGGTTPGGMFSLALSVVQRAQDIFLKCRRYCEFAR